MKRNLIIGTRKTHKYVPNSKNLKEKTSSTKLIMEAVEELYDRIINKNLLVRRIYVVANNVVNESEIDNSKHTEQISLFVDYEKQEKEQEAMKKIRENIIDK